MMKDTEDKMNRDYSDLASAWDVDPNDIAKLAGEAWSKAAQEALDKGIPVTGTLDGKRVRLYPDGKIEELQRPAAENYNYPVKDNPFMHD